MRVFLQETDWTCGVAVVRCILDHYGLRVPSEDQEAISLGASPERGVPPWNLARGLRKHGLQARVCYGSAIIKLPKAYTIIINWHKIDDGHYSIVESVHNGIVKLMDPEEGWNYISVEELEKNWYSPINGKHNLYIRVRK